MAQDRPDRLDRIEATLDRRAQQLDNQVVITAVGKCASRNREHPPAGT